MPQCRQIRNRRHFKLKRETNHLNVELQDHVRIVIELSARLTSSHETTLSHKSSPTSSSSQCSRNGTTRRYNHSFRLCTHRSPISSEQHATSNHFLYISSNRKHEEKDIEQIDSETSRSTLSFNGCILAFRSVLS